MAYHRINGDIFNWKRHRLFDRAITTALLLYCQRDHFAVVKSVETKSVSKWYDHFINIPRRPLPLRTVEMQRTLARLYKWSSERIMQVIVHF
jgi:DNA topoisomerase IA